MTTAGSTGPGPGAGHDAEAGEEISRWWIEPEPTDEELVALVTAITLARRRVAPSPAPSPGGSRWARVGRVAALVPWSRVPGMGWGRGGPGQGSPGQGWT